MNNRQVQPFVSSSAAIRQEIQRFESVHPSIYAIYDIIELIPDPLLAQQIREHVVCIEDSFVNSQEWTLSRSVPDLRLGIVGSISSGKSALVHRYLTGSYMQEESPEGGRFKKEIVIDGSSYLLLIRDEGGPPELQFSAWVDAVIFVFSLENESSFNAIYSYFAKMSQYRSTSDIPFILVGTQDAISDASPRIIDDSRARKLAADLKRCSYYETCATYGLNVDRVFQDACAKIVTQRQTPHFTPNNSRPSTPTHLLRYPPLSNNITPYSNNTYTPTYTPSNPYTTNNHTSPNHGYSNTINKENALNLRGTGGGLVNSLVSEFNSGMTRVDSFREENNFKRVSAPPSAVFMPPPPPPNGGGVTLPPPASSGTILQQTQHAIVSTASSILQLHNNNNTIHHAPLGIITSANNIADIKDLPTPSSTPTTSRKNRRKSNLFTPSKKNEDKAKNGEVGSGRAIPIKQGYLYKKSNKTLNKDWKKKYVTLSDNGKLTYHSSLHDYMEDSHGKVISLQCTTVKVPGMKPRGSRVVTETPPQDTDSNSLGDGVGSNNTTPGKGNNVVTSGDRKDKVTLTSYEPLQDQSNNAATTDSGSLSSKIETPNVKKRHRRMKSSGAKNTECEEPDGYEFSIVSLDNKQWLFEAASMEEREGWVTAIEQQILASLQGNDSNKKKGGPSHDPQAVSMIKTQVAGNDACADCDAPHPEWSSINLGLLVCIECSGIHRNLGSHISKVRSLDLDDWPSGPVSVMLSLGNEFGNRVWEANTHNTSLVKPTSRSSREEKERWIRAKYEHREFLQSPASAGDIVDNLIETVCCGDVRRLSMLLPHNTDVNRPLNALRDKRTLLHLAAALPSLAATQLLIFNNADVSILDSDGRSALYYARAANDKDTMDLLIASGCPDTISLPNSQSSTLPRRKGSISRKPEILDKLQASII